MKMIETLLIVCLMWSFGHIAFAQQTGTAPDGTTIAAPVTVVAPSEQPKAVTFLHSVQDKIPAAFPGWLIGCLVVAVEFLVRLVPSSKPRSLLMVVSSVLVLIAGISTKLSVLLDSVVQKIKPTVP